MRLLVRKTDDTFRMVSLTTKESMDLWKEPGNYVRFILSPSGDEVFFVMMNGTDRYITKRVSGQVEPLGLELSLRDCWRQLTKEKSKCSKGNDHSFALLLLINAIPFR